MYGYSRAGGFRMGFSKFQLEPSQAQVESKSEPFCPPQPPNTTTCPKAGSKPAPPNMIAAGLVAGNCSVQFDPSKVQVLIGLNSAMPPKRTTFLWMGS